MLTIIGLYDIINSTQEREKKNKKVRKIREKEASVPVEFESITTQYVSGMAITSYENSLSKYTTFQ